MHPESEVGKSLQFVCPLIVLDKTAAGPPSTSSILGWLRWCPLPGPLELNRARASCCIVAYKFDMRIFVQIGVRVEFSRYQIVQLSCIRPKYEGQTVNSSIEQASRGDGRGRIVDAVDSRRSRGLSKYKCEVEGELIVVGQAEKKGWRRGCSSRFGILQARSATTREFRPC